MRPDPASIPLVETDYDVVIVGGAYSGASAAILLRREVPGLRVLIVERSKAFDRKVGEATTEVSGGFLTKRLGITHHLHHHHVPKHGLRFWFAPEETSKFEDCTELGPKFQVRLPTFQVDREVLDEYLLSLAVEEGAELLRPARVTGWQAPGAPEKPGSLAIEEEGGAARSIRCRWMLDCSGKAAWLARREGLFMRNEEHPTNAIWARLQGVADWDGPVLRGKFPDYARSVQCSRAAATNHLTGFGWWCWIIPLKGGDYSVGLVYDSRLYEPPEGDSLSERLMLHLRSHPVGREIFAEARPVEGDVKAYSHLPYRSREIAGPGWQIAGDAAGFIDPLYSQGLDYCSWTVSSAVKRVVAEHRGEEVCCRKINEDFEQSYDTWFRALYLDKYHYLGDPRLMTAAFLMDIGTFFMGPVRSIVLCPRSGFDRLPFTGPVDRFIGKIMKYYNARLVCVARNKRRLGTYGVNPGAPAFLIPGFAPGWPAIRLALDGAAIWLFEEIRVGLGLVIRKFHRRSSRRSAAGHQDPVSSTPPVVPPVIHQ
jgi:flavin-dependent dehydrogenase